jgi:nucleotide-binding universal stress UspA family protein
MTPQRIESAFRRILVAIDPSGGARDVLVAAARLAARQEAELLGLFVEDTDVLTLASLPFAREFGLLSAPRPMDPTTTESEIRAQAALVERWLATAARELGLSWSFEIRRGRYESEVLA